MHGWISLPLSWQIVMLIVGLLVGVAARFIAPRMRGFGVAGVALAYAVFCVWIGYQYEIWDSLLGGNPRPWAILVVPAFVIFWPIVAIGASLLGSLRKRTINGVRRD